MLADPCSSPRDVLVAAASRIEQNGRCASPAVDDGGSRVSERGDLTIRSKESAMGECGTTHTVSSSSLATTENEDRPEACHGDSETLAESGTLRTFHEAAGRRLSPAKPLAIFGKATTTDTSIVLEAPRNADGQEEGITEVPVPPTESTGFSSDLSHVRGDTVSGSAVGHIIRNNVPPAVESAEDDFRRKDISMVGDQSPVVQKGIEREPPLPPPPPARISTVELDPSDPYTTIRYVILHIKFNNSLSRGGVS